MSDDTIHMRGVRSGKRDENGIPVGDHRCTPEPIWSVALEAIGRDAFDLDPATNPHSTVPAGLGCFGPLAGGEDGLARAWFGHVWLNFPFSDPNPWVAKVIAEAATMMEPDPVMRSITVLGPGDSSVTWWRALRSSCDAWAMWPRREHFPIPGNAKGSPPAGVHLWYFGPCSNRWRRRMEDHGVPTEAGAIS